MVLTKCEKVECNFCKGKGYFYADKEKKTSPIYCARCAGKGFQELPIKDE